jgi:hypothetical protein
MTDKRKKLSDSEVRWIRRMYRPGQKDRSMAALAKIIGCSATHVRDIIQRKRRANVKEAS